MPPHTPHTPSPLRCRPLVRGAVAALLLLSPGSPATGQETEAGAQGSVYQRLADGGTGARLEGVALQFIRDGSLVERVVSGAGGSYKVALSPGRYETTAKLEGYETATSGFTLQDGTAGYQTVNFFLVALEKAGGEGDESASPTAPTPPQPSRGADAADAGSLGGSVRAGTGSGAFHLNLSAESTPLGGDVRYEPARGAALQGRVSECYRRDGRRVAIAGELIDAPHPYFEIVVEDHGQGRNASEPDRAEFRSVSASPTCDLGTAPAFAVTSGNVDVRN